MANLNNPSSLLEIIDTINGKQDTLISSTNIKTINNESILGSGNITISGGGGTATDVQINGTSITSNNVANIVTNTAYNATSNKIATMSDVPTVNNATLTIQKNGTTVKTFTANASSNVTANITVPTKTSDITNDSGYITGISSSDVTTALGYTPYNSTNPSGYQANVIETVKVNGTAQTVTSKAVDIPVPTKVSQLTNDSGYTTNTGTVTSVNDVSPVNGNVTLTIPSEVTESTVSGWGFTKNTGTVTSVNNVSPVNGNVSLSIPTVPTNISAFNNDSGYITGINSSNVTTALGYTPANTTLSNLGTTSSTNFDGQWLYSTSTLSTATAVGTYTIDLSNYLPNDNYNYEVQIYTSATNSGTTAAQIFIYGAEINRANKDSAYTNNSVTLIIDTNKSFSMQIAGTKFSRCEIFAVAYRRIGTNS